MYQEFLTIFFYSYFLPVLLTKKCDDIIARSGPEGEKVDCYSIKINKDSKPYLWVKSVRDGRVNAIEWDGKQYIKSAVLDYTNFFSFELYIVHYYGLSTVSYSSSLDYILNQITKWPYVKIFFAKLFNHFNQYLFNKRRFVTKKRIELLKFMLDDQIDREEDSIGIMDLMTKLYSINWVLHPSGDQQTKTVQIYVDSLIKSGELQENNRKYTVTGAAIKTIEDYEEKESRHIDSFKISRWMFWLTIVIAVLTFMQTGLIKFPTIYDFSKP